MIDLLYFQKIILASSSLIQKAAAEGFKLLLGTKKC